MFGPNWHGQQQFRQRIFERGDLKYVVLEMLMEKPRHGYEIIRELGERCGGFYTPSPGAVYPTLEMLLDMDYVTAMEQDGKKIYAITEAGRAFVADRKAVIDQIRERMGAWWSPDFRHELSSMKRELRDLGRLFDRRMRTHWADPDRLRQIHAVINKARLDIEEILTQERPAAAASGTPDSDPGKRGRDQGGEVTL
jgi:DNA-binding PadR family transcriptional regulator